MTFPKISIVTPTFNSSYYLEETILSILNQNYPNLEYIIIDGGSTDGTIDIIKKYKSYLTYWISEPDKGMYFALQKGFERSSGEIMAWLNSDDKYHPGAFSTVVQIFSELKDIMWIFGLPTLFNQDGSCVKVFHETKWSRSRFWVGDYRWIQQEGVFWRRSLWDKAGSTLNLNYQLAADFELWCRFFKYTKLYSVETMLSGFRLSGNQLSLLGKEAYECEVKGIAKNTKPEGTQFIRFVLLKCLWGLKNLFILMNFKVTFFIATILGLLIDKLHSYPPIIYYDFDKKKWSI